VEFQRYLCRVAGRNWSTRAQPCVLRTYSTESSGVA
jgi:hypothetical protein